MKIVITRLRDKANLPHYQTPESAGMDLEACIDEPLVLKPHERVVVPTGFAIALPRGFEAQIRARSGLSLKHGITTANGIGTVDADYRGEVGVILVNLGNEVFTIEPGMRVAQMVIARHETAEWELVDALEESERGVGGYGSTGS
jgi:dUTP pyrophosphatase